MNNELLQHWTLDEEKLAAFVLQKIGRKEISLLAAHLEKCSECRKRVQEERELHAGIRRYGHAEMKRKLKLRLRRDQRRRFEWINAASLAAAVVIMLGGVFATRWFFDFGRDKPATREIILSEQKETEPGERPLWIIGKVIEAKEKSEPRKDFAFADKISPEVNGREEILPSETVNISKKESEKMDTSLPAKSSGNIAAIDQESHEITGENIKAAAQARSQLSKESRAFSRDKAKSRIGYDSLAGVIVKPAAAKEYPASIAEAKPEQKKIISKERKFVLAARQRRLLKNIIVRRGDMKDLPASMSSGNAAAIHTKMERISQGILLTFYSNSIKDTTASKVEAITQDSIIVSFRKKQIVYRIPGGLSGGM